MQQSLWTIAFDVVYTINVRTCFSDCRHVLICDRICSSMKVTLDDIVHTDEDVLCIRAGR